MIASEFLHRRGAEQAKGRSLAEDTEARSFDTNS
jgi:hypothetical protein